MNNVTAAAPPASSYQVSSSLDAAAGGNSSSDVAGSQDRFLKLLVAQLNNQDPMNPMDNAQMTSQIAQINTVTGIQQLNTTMQGMAGQFASLQLLQGSALVGKDVLTAGNAMARDGDAAGGMFDLTAAAGNVTVQVMTAGGRVLGNVPLGAMESGRHSFSWDAKGQPATEDLRFRVVAANSGTAVEATPLSRARVQSVSATNGALELQLAGGRSVPYGDVKAVL